MTDVTQDINFHLYHLSRLGNTDDPEEIRTCISHYKAVFDLIEVAGMGRAGKARQAIRLADKAKFEQPKWAVNFFKHHIEDKCTHPKTILIDRKNIELLRTFSERKQALTQAVWLLDKGLLNPSEFGEARALLKTLKSDYTLAAPKELKNPL